jgi:predicted transposase/invertase (TIGR01784 family)
MAEFVEKYLNPYEDSLKYYRDLKASLDTSYEEGMEKGMEKGKHERSVEIARELLANGVDTTIIMTSTGLTREQIERLK